MFKQLISQFAQMHKKTNTAIATWEHHFQKLQYGLPFDEDNPDVIDTSEDENCNKKKYKTILIHRKTGHTTNIKNIRWTNVLKIWWIPKHLDINKKKRWTFNRIHKSFPMKHLIQKQKTKQNQKRNVKACAFVIKKISGIQRKKMWLTWTHGKYATIAKDIINYV